MVVQHCMEAMNANGQLNKTLKANQDSARKLSSGYKINIAADDTAGLAISEKMRKQIRGLTQASENAEDGISMVQTADGALEEVQNMLQRMNQLCVKAANGTNSDTDREYIQDEIDQLNTEIDRVASTTKFNEIYLLNGSIGRNSLVSQSDEVAIEETTKELEKYYTALNGAKAGQRVTKEDVDNTEGTKIVYITDAVATTQSTTSVSSTSTDPKYVKFKNVLQTQIVPNAVQALMDAYPNAYSYLQGSTIGIGLKLGDNSDIGQNTLAYVRLGYSYYNDNSVVSDYLTYQLAVNMDHVTLDANNDIDSTSRENLEVTIVHEMMHAFMDEALTNGMIGTVNGVLSNDRYPTWFMEGMAQTAAGGYYNGNDWVNGSLGITSASTQAQVKAALNKYKLGGSNNICDYGTGYLACMYLGYLAGGGNSVDESTIKSGLDKVLTRLEAGESLKDVVKSLTGYSTLESFQNNFSDIAAGFVLDLTKYVGTGTGGVAGGGIQNAKITLGTNATVPTVFALNTAFETVKNKYPPGYSVFTGGSATNGKGDYDESTYIAASVQARRGVALQVGADGTKNNQIMVYIDAMNAKSLGTLNVSVLTEKSATISIVRVALALTKVSTQRAELGSYQNRLEHTINNLGNVVENTVASESLIRDTDMATEMVQFSNSNILMQVGQSMLAQANQTNQGVLSLLV